jgi:hypothetical protein
MQRSKQLEGPTSDPGSTFYDFSTQEEDCVAKMIETLQNYKQLLRDHQAELAARELLSTNSDGNSFDAAITSAGDFRTLQNGINAVDEALSSLQVLPR